MFEYFEKKTENNIEKDPILILITSSALITLFLFYIDEGYYNFNWMKDVFNWVMFVGYIGVFFLIQFALFRFVSFFFKKSNPYLISIALGTILGTILIFWVFG